MKNIRFKIEVIAAVFILALAFYGAAFAAPVQSKDKAPPQFSKVEVRQLRAVFVTAQADNGAVTRDDLDESARILIGKSGFYQLTDSEGGVLYNSAGQLEPFGRKSYAKITGIPVQRNPDGSLFYDELGRLRFLRDPLGRIVVNLHVERDPLRGGAFDKAFVPFTPGREPGTFDTIQSADTVGL